MSCSHLLHLGGLSRQVTGPPWPLLPPLTRSLQSRPSLAEKLADHKLNVAEVTQSEIGQKQKLQTVLDTVLDLLWPHGWALRWSVDWL